MALTMVHINNNMMSNMEIRKRIPSCAVYIVLQLNLSFFASDL